MKNIYFLTLFFLLSIAFGHSQKTIYLSYDLKEISKDEYYKFSSNRSISGYVHKSDTLIIKKLGFKYWFGQLDSLRYNQIKGYLSSKSRTPIKQNDYIVIAHIDTLHNYESYLKNFVRNYKYNPARHKEIEVSEFNGTKIIRKDLIRTKIQFLNFEDKRIKNTVTCKNRIEKKYNAKVYHTYGEKFYNSLLTPDLNWINDKRIFKNLFFPYESGNKVIIIKPDGEFFVTSFYNSDLEKALLKNQSWTKHKSRLLKIYEKNPLYERRGIFYKAEKNKCFTK